MTNVDLLFVAAPINPSAFPSKASHLSSFTLLRYVTLWAVAVKSMCDDFSCHPQLEPNRTSCSCWKVQHSLRNIFTFIDKHQRTFSHFLANLKVLVCGWVQQQQQQVMDCTLRPILLCKCHSLRLNLCANHLQVVVEPNQLWIHQFAKLGSSQPTAAGP